MAQREIISDRQDNTILLSCLFTYSSIRTRTARGGHFLQAYHAVQDAALPGGLFAFSQEEGTGMDAVVFTKSRQEYGMLSGILADESPGMRVSQGSMDGHYHLEHKYDIVVVGVDGAQGMELVCAYRERFGDALVIWITDDPYFAGVAIRTHIFDFIVRPLAESRFRETVRKLMAGKTDSWQRMPACWRGMEIDCL